MHLSGLPPHQEFTPECQVDFEGGRTLDKHYKNCTKNPGHPNFIPVNKLTKDDLTPALKTRENIMDLIQARIDQTVRVRVAYTSLNRPDYFSDNKRPYPYADYKGNVKVIRYGTGSISRLLTPDPVRDKPCPCLQCRQTPGSTTRMHCFLTVRTSTHVIFDNSEAERSRFDCFFDSSEMEGKFKLFGLRLNSERYTDHNQYESDHCEVLCVAHDEETIQKLTSQEIFASKLPDGVPGFVTTVAPPSEVIVSHPHGCSKQITFGTVIHITVPVKPSYSTGIPIMLHEGTRCRLRGGPMPDVISRINDEVDMKMTNNPPGGAGAASESKEELLGAVGGSQMMCAISRGPGDVTFEACGPPGDRAALRMMEKFRWIFVGDEAKNATDIETDEKEDVEDTTDVETDEKEDVKKTTDVEKDDVKKTTDVETDDKRDFKKTTDAETDEKDDVKKTTDVETDEKDDVKKTTDVETDEKDDVKKTTDVETDEKDDVKKTTDVKTYEKGDPCEMENNKDENEMRGVVNIMDTFRDIYQFTESSLSHMALDPMLQEEAARENRVPKDEQIDTEFDRLRKRKLRKAQPYSNENLMDDEPMSNTSGEEMGNYIEKLMKSFFKAPNMGQLFGNVINSYKTKTDISTDAGNIDFTMMPNVLFEEYAKLFSAKDSPGDKPAYAKNNMISLLSNMVTPTWRHILQKKMAPTEKFVVSSCSSSDGGKDENVLDLPSGMTITLPPDAEYAVRYHHDQGTPGSWFQFPPGTKFTTKNGEPVPIPDGSEFHSFTYVPTHMYACYTIDTCAGSSGATVCTDLLQYEAITQITHSGHLKGNVNKSGVQENEFHHSMGIWCQKTMSGIFSLWKTPDAPDKKTEVEIDLD